MLVRKPKKYKVYKENEKFIVERDGKIVSIFDNQTRPILIHWLKETKGLSNYTINGLDKYGEIEWIDL